MGKTLSSIQEYAMIAFTLLGILFGMLIIAFIFGQLGKENIKVLDDDSITAERIAFINSSNYTIPEAVNSNFNGGFIVVTALNRTDGSVIEAGNYTATAATGVLYKATTETISYDNVTLTYTFSQKTDARMRTEATTNNSLQSIQTYTEGSDTQFTTISIAIILVILIGVFLLFWKIFVAKKKSKDNSYGGNFE